MSKELIQNYNSDPISDNKHLCNPVYENLLIELRHIQTRMGESMEYGVSH
jgi:hypothetical protein